MVGIPRGNLKVVFLMALSLDIYMTILELYLLIEGPIKM